MQELAENNVTIHDILGLFGLSVAMVDGTLVVNHTSGSSLTMHESGDVTLHAAKNLHLSSDRYVFHGPYGDEDQADRINMQRALQNDPEVLDAIANGHLKHLRDWAVELGITLPYE